MTPLAGSGIPQGSVVLFAIYVNNLPQVVAIESLIALFADETQLYHSITSDLSATKRH